MPGRVTHLQMSNTFISDLQRIYSGLADKQREIATGKRINTASDDPFGAAQVMTFDAQLSDIRQYERNVEDALGFLNTADSSLQGVLDTLTRARELMVQALNSTNDQSALDSIAREMSQLKEALRDKANTRYGSLFVFSGTATTSQPYPPPANAYQGNNGLLNRRVSPGLQVSINVDGPSVFGTTTGAAITQLDMFDMMDQIVTDLGGGVRDSNTLTAIDAHFENVTRQLANVGATASRLEVTRDRLSDLELRISEARSKVADADMAKTYMEFQTQNTMYQSALAAGSRIMTTSLLDFI